MPTTDDRSVEEKFRDDDLITAALRQAVAEELERRRRLGLPIVTAENGTVRVIESDHADGSAPD